MPNLTNKLRQRRFGVVLAATLVVTGACSRSHPLDQQVLAAEHLEYLTESFPADGGSRVFFFYVHPPQRQRLAVLVRHRNPAIGGNADFQEIWLDRSGGFRTHIDVQPGSALEAKLLQLLRTATINTNADSDLPFRLKPAKLDELNWLAERMKDRKSKW